MTLRYHAVEEVYELMDAIEAATTMSGRGDGRPLLQIVFHCQLARERGPLISTASAAAREQARAPPPARLREARHKRSRYGAQQWEREIKRRKKSGTRHERPQC